MIQDSPFPQPMPGPGGPVPPVMTSDQIMQHVDQVYQGLPQPVKSALDYAHTRTGGAPSSTLSGVAKPPAAPLDTAPPPVSTADAGLPTLPQTPMAKPAPGPMQQELSRVTAPPLSGSLAHTKADTGLSGVEQIHNPFLRVPLQVLEGAFNTFVPGGRAFTSYIPGTESHHEAIVRSDTNAAKEEQEAQKAADESTRSATQSGLETAQAGAIPSEVALRNAQAEEARQRAENLRNPPGVVKEKQILYDKAGDPIGYQDEHGNVFGPQDPSLPQGVKDVLSAARSKTPNPNIHELPDGTVVAITVGKDGKPTATEVYKGDPKIETIATQREVNGRPHTVLVNRQTGDDIKDLGPTGEKPSTGEQGTWTLEEDANGKPVLMNTKTSEIKPVEGVQKTGTKAKADEAQEKKEGPARDAMAYAEAYSQMPPTGPGDEALMEKYFELAKPSSGFRMSQPQIDMLKHAQGWMNSIGAKARHLTTGTWFSDEQRKQIIDTMRTLEQSKQQPASAAASGKNTGDITLDQINAEVARRKAAKK